MVPNWQSIDEGGLEELGQSYKTIREQMAKQIDHPFQGKVMRVTNRYSIYFSLLKKAFEKDPDRTLQLLRGNHDEFQAYMTDICGETYKQNRSHLLADTFK